MENKVLTKYLFNINIFNLSNRHILLHHHKLDKKVCRTFNFFLPFERFDKLQEIILITKTVDT